MGREIFLYDKIVSSNGGFRRGDTWDFKNQWSCTTRVARCFVKKASQLWGKGVANMRIYIFLFIMPFLLSGCYWQEQHTTPLEIQTIPSTFSATEDVNHPASSPIKLPAPSPSVIPTTTNTPVVLATRTRADAMAIIDVLTEEPGCTLPCWLGLTPGVSKFEDVQGFAARLGLNFSEENYDKEDDTALLYVVNSENHKKSSTNNIGNPILIDVRWQKGIVKSIIIRPNEVPEFLSVDQQRDQLGYPEHIFLTGPYGKTMGFILDYQRHGFIFALNSVTSKQATICLGDSLDKSIVIVLYDPDEPIDIQNQEDLFDDLVWETQADPGYSTKEIMDRIVSNECLHHLDFAKEW